MNLFGSKANPCLVTRSVIWSRHDSQAVLFIYGDNAFAKWKQSTVRIFSD
jgi:hypothetical protein